MVYQTVCDHCPYVGGCRYYAAGASVAEIAYWAVYRRDARRLMSLYPQLTLERIRRGLERFMDCPGHPAAGPALPRRRVFPAVA